MKKILLILLFLISITANATTYYVATAANGGNDANDGSIGSPWLTVDYAATQVTTAGDIIYVTAGTYTEPNRIELSVGVSILGTGDASHIISTYHPVGADSYDGSIYIRSASKTNGNQSVSYIKLTGSSLTAWYGIYIANRHNVDIHHCTIEDFRDRGVKYWGDADTSGEYITGSEVYNCTITNSADRVSGGGGNLHFEGQDGMLIHDNIFSCIDRAAGDNGNIISVGDGWNKGIKYYNNKSYTLESNGTEWNMHIEHWDSRGGIEIYNNEFYGGGCYIDMGGFTNSKGTYDYSFYVHDNLFARSSTQPYNAGRENNALAMEGACSDIIIERNHFKYQQFCIKHSLATAGLVHERIYVRYNIFENIGLTNNNWSAGIMYSLSAANDTVDNVYYYNNVFTGSSAALLGVAGSLYQFDGDAGQLMTNVLFKNNIFQGLSTAPFWVYTSTVIASLTNSNNILYLNGNSNDIKLESGASVTTYTIADTLKRDPVFVGSTDFQLHATSPAINNGVNVGLTSDFIGTVVPQGGGVDIGAYEYIYLPIPLTGLGWEPVLSKRNFKDDVNLGGIWAIEAVPVTASATEINTLIGIEDNVQEQIDNVTTYYAKIYTAAGDTSNYPIPAKVGDLFIDTSADKVYVAITAARNGWVILNFIIVLAYFRRKRK